MRMQVVGAPAEVPAVQDEVHRLCEPVEGRQIAMAPLSREDFYVRARRAIAVVATSEAPPYGCFVLVKGVLAG